MLVPAERFLQDADGCSARAGKVGVIWPNNRDIDELVPYLGRLAAVALVFPTFRDGRAYSQARLLRERYGYRGELRATGQVLRDQFVFMLRAGFDSFEVKKQADARSLRADREALFGVLSADRRRPHHGAASAHAAAPFRRCRHVSAHRASGLVALPSRLLPRRRLDRALRDASPADSHCRRVEDGRARQACAGVVVRHGIGGAAEGRWPTSIRRSP